MTGKQIIDFIIEGDYLKAEDGLIIWSANTEDQLDEFIKRDCDVCNNYQ